MPDGKISYQDLIRDEYRKCLESPVYFMKHYVKIKHPIRGTILFDLYKFQEETLQAFHDHQFNIAGHKVLLNKRQGGLLVKGVFRKSEHAFLFVVFLLMVG